MRAKIVIFFEIYYYFGVKRGIPAAASKKSRQWLYTLVLSIAEFFRRALHLTPFDTKMVRICSVVQSVFSRCPVSGTF